MKISFSKGPLFWEILFIVHTCLMVALPAASSSPWTVEALDEPRTFSHVSSRAIAIDGSHRLHIVYGKDHLYHACPNAGSWNLEIVDSSPGVGSYASIAIDSTDKVHISYHDSINNHLKYATNTSGGWVIETVDSTGIVGRGTSITLDSAGKVHIAYYDWGNWHLKYATNAFGKWVTMKLDTQVYGYCSIAVDSIDKVHISYCGYSRTLKYATNASGKWVTETVDDDIGERESGLYSSIAIDSSDRVHISYYLIQEYPFFLRALKYATNVSGKWVIKSIDTPAGTYTSIAIDSADKVHISYHDEINDDLKYATNVSGSWVTETVDSVGHVGLYTAISLDSMDKVHISYCGWDWDWEPGDEVTVLKYATNVSGYWETETMDTASEVGLFTSIALDSADKVHISYCDALNDDLKYTTNTSGIWVIETVDDGYVGYTTSLALDSADKVHISYLYWDTQNLKYTTNASGAWVIETVDDGYTFHPSLAVDSKDKVHISYATANDDVKYATNASGAWVAETVDSFADFNYTSIAIDSADKVHISYCRDGTDELKYATNASGSWVTETVVGPGGVDGHTSIALDSSDNVHISYRDRDSESVKYATNSSNGWVVEMVDNEYGIYISIALDSSDKVHISYWSGYLSTLNGYLSTLKYANNVRGRWMTQTVDGGGDIGQYTSIAIDSSDRVHISYHDEANKDLKYAYWSAPIPDIKANDSDGPITIPYGSNLTVTVALNPGSYGGEDADWWVAANSPFGRYWYTLDNGWVRADPSIRVYGGPLFDLSSREVLNKSNLPVGGYTFYFGVDLLMNGSLDFSELYFDRVDVTIE